MVDAAWIVSMRPSADGRVVGQTGRKPADRALELSAMSELGHDSHSELICPSWSPASIELDLFCQTKTDDRKRNAIRDRRARAEEKKRLEEMAARMSAKKLQRMRKVSSVLFA